MVLLEGISSISQSSPSGASPSLSETFLLRVIERGFSLIGASLDIILSLRMAFAAKVGTGVVGQFT